MYIANSDLGRMEPIISAFGHPAFLISLRSFCASCSGRAMSSPPEVCASARHSLRSLLMWVVHFVKGSIWSRFCWLPPGKIPVLRGKSGTFRYPFQAFFQADGPNSELIDGQCERLHQVLDADIQGTDL